MKKPVRYHGYIHTLDKKDKRLPKFKKQLTTAGFDDTELWNLDETFVRFIAPRLNAFCSANSDKEFQKKLKHAKQAFNALAEAEDFFMPKSEKDLLVIIRGLKAFADIFLCLWN